MDLPLRRTRQVSFVKPYDTLVPRRLQREWCLPCPGAPPLGGRRDPVALCAEWGSGGAGGTRFRELRVAERNLVVTPLSRQQLARTDVPRRLARGSLDSILVRAVKVRRHR